MPQETLKYPDYDQALANAWEQLNFILHTITTDELTQQLKALGLNDKFVTNHQEKIKAYWALYAEVLQKSSPGKLFKEANPVGLWLSIVVATEQKVALSAKIRRQTQHPEYYSVLKLLEALRQALSSYQQEVLVNKIDVSKKSDLDEEKVLPLVNDSSEATESDVNINACIILYLIGASMACAATACYALMYQV